VNCFFVFAEIQIAGIVSILKEFLFTKSDENRGFPEHKFVTNSGAEFIPFLNRHFL